MALNVLVVDPSGESRESLKRSLTQALGEVTFGEAKDSRAALAGLERVRADLIITDLELPGADGKTYLKKMLGVLGNIHPPLVAIVRRVTPELLHEFKKDPMVWFVQKPAGPGEIADLAGKLLHPASLFART